MNKEIISNSNFQNYLFEFINLQQTNFNHVIILFVIAVVAIFFAIVIHFSEFKYKVTTQNKYKDKYISFLLNIVSLCSLSFGALLILNIFDLANNNGGNNPNIIKIQDELKKHNYHYLPISTKYTDYMNITLFICGNNIENVIHEKATKTRCTDVINIYNEHRLKELTKQSEKERNELNMQKFDELLKKQKLN